MSKFLNNKPILMISEQARLEKLNLISAFGTAAQLYEAAAGQLEKKRRALYDAFAVEQGPDIETSSILRLSIIEEYKEISEKEKVARNNSAGLFSEAAEIAEELARGLK